MSKPSLMLHICCAPDATVPWLELCADYDVCGFFFGGNIHPVEEYAKRREAVEILSRSLNKELLIQPYDTIGWFKAVKGLENEAEGGKRCLVCFHMQLEAAAQRAVEKGCTHLCTTLTISPHKDVVLLNEIGAEAAGRLGLVWLKRVWRKNGGFKRSIEASKRLGLYRQHYCGCIFSTSATAYTDCLRGNVPS